MFAAWGHLVYRWRWPVLVLSAVLFAATIFTIAQGGTLKAGGIIETSESGRALSIMREELPRASGSSFWVVFASESLPATDPRYKAAVERALAEVRRDPRVRDVSTPYDTSVPSPRSISADGRKAVAFIAVQDEISEAQQYYPELRAMIRSDELSITASGNIAITHDFNEILESDLLRAEIVSLPVALVLLVLVFSTIAAALLTLGVGILAVVGGVAGTFALTRITDVSQYALNVVTLIGLGVAIDY